MRSSKLRHFSGGFRLLLVTITAGCLPLLLADVTLTPEGHGCCLTVLVQVIRFHFTKKLDIHHSVIFWLHVDLNCRMPRAALPTWMVSTSWRWTRWTNQTPTVWTAACTRGAATPSWRRTSIALLGQTKQEPLSSQAPVLLSQQQMEVQQREVQQVEVQLEAQRLELQPSGAPPEALQLVA